MARASLETVLRKIKRNRTAAVRKIELQTTSADKRAMLRLEVQALNKLERLLKRKHVQQGRSARRRAIKS